MISMAGRQNGFRGIGRVFVFAREKLTPGQDGR